MSILFIGSYRDGSGWSQASIDYIKAINASGIDIAIRPLKLNNYAGKIDDELSLLEKKSTEGRKVCIQHVLPHFMQASPNHYNIGLFVTETDSCPMTNWVRKLNMMDEVWVPNTDMIDWCINNGVKRIVKVIPHACNIEKFKHEEKLDLPLDGGFTFYFIGELIRRKNISAILKAFHLEFTWNEPVNLVLKVSKPGASSEETYKEINNQCNINKKSLRLYKNEKRYHQEIIISDRLSDEQILGLHKACDCFVGPSYGEAWNQGAFDAMGFGNIPICTNVGGMKDYIKKGGFLVNGREEPVVGAEEFVNKLHIGYENWTNIDVNLLRKAMRFVYQFRNHDMVKSLREYGKNDAKAYSYQKIGKLIKDTLCL